MKKQLWTAVLAVCLCVCMGATASFVSAQEGDFTIELVNGIGVRHGAKKMVAWITPCENENPLEWLFDTVRVEFIIDDVSYATYYAWDTIKWVPGQGAWLGAFSLSPDTMGAITLTNSVDVDITLLDTSPWQSGENYYPINMPALPGFLPPYS